MCDEPEVVEYGYVEIGLGGYVFRIPFGVPQEVDFPQPVAFALLQLLTMARASPDFPNVSEVMREMMKLALAPEVWVGEFCLAPHEMDVLKAIQDAVKGLPKKWTNPNWPEVAREMAARSEAERVAAGYSKEAWVVKCEAEAKKDMERIDGTPEERVSAAELSLSNAKMDLKKESDDE